jgi:hypothetical protein
VTVFLPKPCLSGRPPAPDEHRLPSHGLAFTFAGIHVDAPKKPAMDPPTAMKVFETFHSMHDHFPSSTTGDALLKMDTSAPAGTTAKQIYNKAQRLHKKGRAHKAGQARDFFLAKTSWSWPGNDNVTHNTTQQHSTHTTTCLDTHTYFPQTQALEDQLVRVQEENRLQREHIQEVDEKLRKSEEERVDLKKSSAGLQRELTRTKWAGHSNRSQLERRERVLLRSEAALEQKSKDVEMHHDDVVRQEADAAERSKEVDERIGKRWKLYETIASLKAELDEARALVSKSVDSEVERAQKSKIGLLEDEVDRLLLVTDELSDRLQDANHASGERKVSLRDVEPTE